MLSPFRTFLVSGGVFPSIALLSAVHWAPVSADERSRCCTGEKVYLQVAKGRQLSGREIRRRVVGKLVQYERQLPTKRGVTVKGALWGILRFDGSFWHKCEWYNSNLDQWYPCISFQPNSRHTGWTNGTWVIRNNLVCVTASTLSRSGERCFTISNVMGRLLVEKVSGPEPAASLPGYIDVSPPKDLRLVGNVRGARSLTQLSQKLGVRLPVMSIIQKPGPEVPAKYSAFVGVWAGHWRNVTQQKHVLIVERIRGHEALVIYAWGKFDGGSRKWGSGWIRTKALFKGDYLVVSRPATSVTAEYKIVADGTIEHRIERRKPRLSVSGATMKRVRLE